MCLVNRLIIHFVSEGKPSKYEREFLFNNSNIKRSGSSLKSLKVSIKFGINHLGTTLVHYMGLIAFICTWAEHNNPLLCIDGTTFKHFDHNT